MSRIYTRSGDRGTTSLANGHRSRKDDRRIEAIGSVDECNAQIGLLISQLSEEDELRPVLTEVQHRLFDVGAALATAKKVLLQEDIDSLEHKIDRMSARLNPLKQFVLPGGNIPASTAHVARTVCRRAERQVVALHNSEELSSEPPSGLLSYMNRLSDLLFIIARTLAARDGGDVLWIPSSGDAHQEQI